MTSHQEQQGYTVWFTGLSGAGKSTLAELLYHELRRRDVLLPRPAQPRENRGNNQRREFKPHWQSRHEGRKAGGSFSRRPHGAPRQARPTAV